MLDKILGFIATKLAIITHDSGWLTLPAGTASGYTKVALSDGQYRTKGGLCFLKLASSSNNFTAGWKNVGLLPANARPKQLINASGANRNGVSYEIQIQDSGQVFINTSASTIWISEWIVFPCSAGGGVLLNPHFSTFTAVLQKIGGGLDVGQDISVYPLRNGIRVQSPHKLFDRHKHYDQSETIQTRRFGCSNILLNEQLEVHCLDVRSSGQFDKLKDLNTVQQLQRTDRNERDRRYRISDLCWLQNDIATPERGCASC